MVDIKGWKALGNQLTPHKVKQLQLIDDQPQPSKNTPDKAKQKDKNDSSLASGDAVEWVMEKDKNTESSNSKNKKPKDQLGLF